MEEDDLSVCDSGVLKIALLFGEITIPPRVDSCIHPLHRD